MKLYMKQHTFSIRQNFDIYDENERVVYYVEGEWPILSRKLTIFDAKTNREVAFVKEKVLTFLPTVSVEVAGEQVAMIRKKFTFFTPAYSVEGLGWEVEGDFFAHDYTILSRHGRRIATIQKRFLSWSDTFEIHVLDTEEADVGVVLAVVLAIDAAMDRQS